MIRHFGHVTMGRDPVCHAHSSGMTTALPDEVDCHACLDIAVTLGVAAAKRLRDLRAAEPAPEPCSRCGRPEAPECCAAGPPVHRAARVERRG